MPFYVKTKARLCKAGATGHKSDCPTLDHDFAQGGPMKYTVHATACFWHGVLLNA